MDADEDEDAGGTQKPAGLRVERCDLREVLVDEHAGDEVVGATHRAG